MNFLFRFFIFLGSLVVLALFAALFAPYFVNWDKFTKEFEIQASRVIGQDVRVGGKTNLRILPLPFLSFENLQVGRNEDGSPLMTVDQFSLNAELLPFLSGEVRIVDMAMLRPALNLQVAEDGTVAWTSPTEQLVNPELVNIESLKVENGSVTVSGLVGDRLMKLDNIQGDFQANTILGPWRIDATADVDGIASRIKAATGSFQDDGSMRLKLDLNRLDEPYNLLLDGAVRLQEEALSYNGNFRVSPFSQLQIEQMDTGVQPLPVFSTGTFKSTPKKILVDEYRLEIGSRDDPYIVTGQADINLENDIFFKMQADGRQINVDQLDTSENTEQQSTMDARFAAVFDVLKRVPVPTAKGNIDILLPAIAVGDTFIRNVQLNVSPTGEGWVVRKFGISLPGNTTLEANGRLGLKNGFGFSGNLLLASRQPSGLAGWVSGEVDETFRRLNTLGFSSDITISSRQASFENVELRLDDAVLKGKIRRLSGSGLRPAILAELKGNRVNIDELKAIYSLTQNPDQEAPHELDAKVKADIFEASFRGMPISAEALDAHMIIKDGSVSIERLNAARLLGAGISTTGSIANILEKPNGNMKLELDAKDGVELLSFAKQFLGNNSLLEHWLSAPELTQDSKLVFELDTTEIENGAKGVLLVKGVTGGSALSLKVGFDGPLGDLTKTPLMISGILGNDQPLVLMQQVGIETLPVDLVSGLDAPARLDFTLAGSGVGGFETQAFVASETLNISASGAMNTRDWNAYDLDMDITIGSTDLAPFIKAANLPLPVMLDESALPFSSAFKFVKAGSNLSFQDISGQVSNNRFSGRLDLQREQVARPRLEGELEVSRLALQSLTEAVLGRTNSLAGLLGVGEALTLADDSLFGEALYAGYDANIKVNAQQVFIAEQLEGREFDSRLVMSDGAISLNAFSLKLMDGEVTGDLNLENKQGIVIGDLNYSAQDISSQRFADYVQLPPVFNGNFSLNGSLEANGQTVSALVSSLSGNGFLSGRSIEVNGLKPEVFEQILSATSDQDYEISSDNIQQLVSDLMLLESFEVPILDAPFSINRGVLRARNISQNLDDVELTSDIEVNLPVKMLEANMIVGFKPSRRSQIAGADPQVAFKWQGELASLNRFVDTDGLEGYLSLRAFENSKRRIETLEAQVIEKQRLRGQIAYAFAREQYEERQRQEALRLEEERKLRQAQQEEAERQRLIEEENQRAEAERKRLIAEENQRAEGQRQLQLRIQAEEAARNAEPEIDTETIAPSVRENIFDNIEDLLRTN